LITTEKYCAKKYTSVKPKNTIPYWFDGLDFLKVHAAVDVESKRLLPIKITEEDTSDREVLRHLLKDVNFEDALADGAYDTKDAFEGLFSSGLLEACHYSHSLRYVLIY
jgi:hypothetical protein